MKILAENWKSVENGARGDAETYTELVFQLPNSTAAVHSASDRELSGISGSVSGSVSHCFLTSKTASRLYQLGTTWYALLYEKRLVQEQIILDLAGKQVKHFVVLVFVFLGLCIRCVAWRCSVSAQMKYAASRTSRTSKFSRSRAPKAALQMRSFFICLAEQIVT